MTRTLKDFLENRDVDRQAIDGHKKRMLDQVRAYQLKELRLAAGLSQDQLAQRIGVGQRQVSKIECGDLDNARVGTIRKYLAAVGGEMTIEYISGDHRTKIA